MTAAPTPSTVTEAVAYLRAAGYTDDVELDDGHLACTRTGARSALDHVIVDHTFRFEGDSDPGDEAIVLGLHFPDGDVRATLVSAFGPGAEPQMAAFLARLHEH